MDNTTDNTSNRREEIKIKVTIEWGDNINNSKKTRISSSNKSKANNDNNNDNENYKNEFNNAIMIKNN